MALVSAVVSAVTIATAVTTVGTVATAVAAVGNLVAAIGMAVTAVGAITGSKDLMQIGGYLGMAGGGMSIGGWVTSGISQAGGVGNWIKSGVESVKGAFTPATSTPGAGTAPGVTGAQSTAVANPVVPDARGAGLLSQPSSPTNIGTLPVSGPAPSAISPVPSLKAPSSIMPGPTAPIAPVAPAAPVAPVAPAIPDIGAGMAQVAANASPAVSGVSKVANIWANLPDSAKAHLMLAGGQGLAGMAGGMFESMSASERLELDQLINQQRQNQVNEINKRSSYAPTVNFQGLLNTPGRA